MNIPRCPEKDCGAFMIPLFPQFAEFEPVTYRCTVHVQWEIDEDAIKRNQIEFLKRRQPVADTRNPLK